MFEKLNFEGWDECIRLSNYEIELIATTAVGPRIISFGYRHGQNLLYISKDDAGKMGGNMWRIYGGHRLWISPEEMPKTYSPDNKRINYSWDGRTLKLTQGKDPVTGLIKEMEITLETGRNCVSVLHRVVNATAHVVELAPWGITAMSGGGMAILPHEPYIAPEDFMLPSRPLVLWHYTHMDDPRWIWGRKFIRMKFDPAIKTEQKIGILNKQGWAAYYLNSELFVKTFKYDEKATYTDYGCNNELYMNGSFVELETIGPFVKILPEGTIEHNEFWHLSKVNIQNSEESIEKNVLPAVKSVN